MAFSRLGRARCTPMYRTTEVTLTHDYLGSHEVLVNGVDLMSMGTQECVPGVVCLRVAHTHNSLCLWMSFPARLAVTPWYQWRVQARVGPWNCTWTGPTFSFQARKMKNDAQCTMQTQGNFQWHKPEVVASATAP